MSIATGANTLLQVWAGPYGGVPPLDRVVVADFKPALEAAMAENLAEVEAIAHNAEPATFENTLAALERSGRALDRVHTVFAIWGSCMNTADFQAVEREMAPKLAAFADQIVQNEALFRRIEAVYQSPQKHELTSEQQRLAWLYYTDFVHAGARLDQSSKARLSQINQRLAELFTAFSQHVLGDETNSALIIEQEAELAGLPEPLRTAAAAAAEARGVAGKWVIPNTRSAIEPFLTYAARRELRERAWQMWVGRGDNGNEHDTNHIIAQILALRAERAQLLGFSTHAHWRLENSMARTPERALAFMLDVWAPATARVREEVDDMLTLARADDPNIRIEPWDYRYYAEKVRKARYDLDQNEVKAYLQLDCLRDAMFWVAGELFDLAFEPLHDVPVYHPDVHVWQVTDRHNGEHIGVWYFDPYARAGKRSGAWMNAYRRQERFDDVVTTIVSNNSNFVKPAPGEPVLISWEDANTLFHEFGHALHGLISQVNYPSLAGTAVARDYVEFPSQLLEHWLSTDEVLHRFAIHHRTGEPIPEELVARIRRAATFNQGFATAEYLASALVDMKLHIAAVPAFDARAFERAILQELEVPREVGMRHRLPHFQHIFASDGYSAAYYSYLWADVLTADAFEAFTEAGGPYDREVAQRLRQHVFAVGNTIDPANGYRAFRGRDAEAAALMRKRGFPAVQS